MHIFQIFDIFRLNKYKKRKLQIELIDNKNITLLRYNEVDYFNYIHFKDISILESDEIYKLFIKYLNDGKKSIKLIYPKLLSEKMLPFIEEQSITNKIVCLEKNVISNVKISNTSILSKVETNQDLLIFTELYLLGFGSNNIDYEEVSKNFKLLKESEEIDFFIIKHNNNNAGICINHYCNLTTVLAACTISKPYRELGLQKTAIKARIEIGQQKGYKNFTAWAYNNSISHKNMLKSGFSNHSFYEESISKPLDDIIKTKTILQKQTYC